jgi:hypothetical protein
VNLLRSNSRWNGRAANQRANAKTIAAARRSPRRSVARAYSPTPDDAKPQADRPTSPRSSCSAAW